MKLYRVVAIHGGDLFPYTNLATLIATGYIAFFYFFNQAAEYIQASLRRTLVLQNMYEQLHYCII